MPQIDEIIVNGVSYDIGGVTDDIKQASLQIAAKVAYIDEHGQDYYEALEDAFYPSGPRTLTSISAVYTQSGTVYNSDSLNVLKTNLIVTAHYDDSSSSVISSGYALSGTLTVGTSTITVTYMDKTTTFNVTVTDSLRTLTFFKGTNVWINPYNQIEIGGRNNTRACCYLTEQINGGGLYYVPSSWTGLFTDEAYPIPIPSEATKVSVICQGDLCCAISCHRDIDGVVTAVDNGYWSSAGGETNYDLSTFIANGGTHISIGFKNSSDTSVENYTIDSTTISISFS